MMQILETLLECAPSNWFQPHFERSEKPASKRNRWVAKSRFLASLRNEADERDTATPFSNLSSALAASSR